MSTDLPPGQHAIDGFPRWGTHLHHPPPVVPSDPVIEITGAAARPFAVSLADLAALPRREVRADFHCVAGWSATGLRWEGVAFAAFYHRYVAPSLRAGAAVTHVRFSCLDGYWSVALLEDALGDDVLIADRLDGKPLDGDHGAPARLVSPGQYGFVNAKHLSGIELLDEAPRESNGSATTAVRVGLRLLGFQRFSRARVWQEERHTVLPAWFVRNASPLFISPIAYLSSRGAER